MKHRLKMLWHRLLKAAHLCPLSVLQRTQLEVRLLEARNENQYNRLVRYMEFLHELADGLALHEAEQVTDRAKELLP